MALLSSVPKFGPPIRTFDHCPSLGLTESLLTRWELPAMGTGAPETVSGPASADGDNIVIYDFSLVFLVLPVCCPEVRFLADVDQPLLGVKHAVCGPRMLGKKLRER